LDKGHGRLEVRRLWARSELQGYLDFPYAAQVYCLERETTELTTGEFRAETVHGVTSLSAEEADPVRLLSLNRSPWTIENDLHYVRDPQWPPLRHTITSPRDRL
jgi:hypothetical protein